MALYQYIVKDKEGRKIKRVEEVSSKKELIEKLKNQGFFIVSIKELDKTKERGVFLRYKRKSLKQYDLVFFARNLAIALSAGLPLVRSLEVLSSQSESEKLSKILQGIIKEIKKGLSLSEAMAKFPQVFSSLWIGMVESGEASGSIVFTLEKLADYLEMRADFERKIKGFLIYPSILFTVAIFVVFIFFKFILPRFNEIIKQFDISLPLPTRILFNISKFVNEYIWLIILIIIGGIFLIWWGRKIGWGKIFWDRLILNIPFLGKIIRLVYLERYCSLMYILLESGVPIVYVLEIVSRSMGSVVFQKRIDQVKEGVKKGKGLASEIMKFSLFPPLISEIIHIGEEAGNLSQMFEKISTYYQKELSMCIERLVYIFEPIMIVIMAIIIGSIVISLFLPLFKISTLGA